MDKLVYSIDIGTQSLRGMFIDTQGNIVEHEQCIYDNPCICKNPRWAEQEPDFYFNALCEVSKKLAARCSDLFKKTAAVTVTTIRDTVLCLDKDCNPLRNIIIWLDKREADPNDLPRIPFYKRLLFALVGMKDVVETQQKQSVCNWIMTKEPEIWKKTYKYVVLSTYINYKLTGVLSDSKPNQSAHIPFDAKKGIWQGKSITRFVYDIPVEKLCDLCDSGDEIGKITNEASLLSGIPEGLPLIATGTDKSCETLGLSVNSPGKAAISLGTASTIEITTSKYMEPVPFAPGYMSAVKGKWNAEVQIYRGFWMLSWFKNQFASSDAEVAAKKGCSVEQILDSHLREIPPGCDGLILQPHWGPGVCTPNARGTIIGFTDVHTRYHVYRAIIEGICFELYDAMRGLEKRSACCIREVFAGGGGSVSDDVCQILSNVFGLPVNRIQSHESCGLGAAMVAFVSLGVFDTFDEAISKMVRVCSTFTPDSSVHEYYDFLYKSVYKKLYKKILPFCRILKKHQFH